MSASPTTTYGAWSHREAGMKNQSEPKAPEGSDAANYYFRRAIPARIAGKRACKHPKTYWEIKWTCQNWK
jgi:hypothetical protein